MRPILVLLAFSALAGAANAQPTPRYLTWPGKTEPAAAPTTVALPMAASAVPLADPTPALTPSPSDRYGPRRDRPAAAPQPVAYTTSRVAPAAPSLSPAPSWGGTVREADRVGNRPATPAPAAYPTIYDAPPPLPAPIPNAVIAEAAPPPAPTPAVTPPAATQTAPTQTAARQPWSAGRGEAQGVPWRRYSVQREATAETATLDPAFLAQAGRADLAEPPAVDPWYPPQQQAQPAPNPVRAR